MTRIVASLVTMLFLAVSTLLAQISPPPPQMGVSVQMAVTESAQPMPAADDANAWVVTIDHSGTVFFRSNRTDVAELTEWMKAHPRDRDAKLYIKADVGTAFGIVHKVLTAGHEVWFDAPVLLTSQSTPASSTGLVPPMGVAVQMTPPTEKDLISVQVLKTNHPTPLVKINNQPIPSHAFALTLGGVLQNRKDKDKTILLKADDHLLFSDVIHVIDECHSAGSNVVLVNFE